MTPAAFRFEPLGEEHDRSAFHCGAYYTLSAASVALTELPPEVTKRLPRYPTLPAVRIGRLAVDGKFQGRGLGAAMLMNAAHRSMHDAAAAFTLLVGYRSRGVIQKGRSLEANATRHHLVPFVR